MLQLTSKARICELCSRASSFNVISKLIHDGGSGGKEERVTGFLPHYSSRSRPRDPLLGGMSARDPTGGSAQSYRPRLGIPVVLLGMSLSAQHRRFGTSHMRWKENNKTDTPEDLSQDPQIKEWMKELHKDFEKEKGAVEEKKDDEINGQESPTENEEKKAEGSQSDCKKAHRGNRNKGIQPGVIKDTDIPSSTTVTSEAPLHSPVKGENLFVIF